jgi:predicted transcriptional regulator
MSERFIIALSDDLNAEIEAAAKASETSKSEILRKAIQL